MGLPTRSAVRSIDTTVAGIDLRLTAFDGDALVCLSPSGSEVPRAGEVDRIDHGADYPRIALYDSGLIPGLFDAADAVKAVAVDFYRHPDQYDKPVAGTTPATATTGSAP